MPSKHRRWFIACVFFIPVVASILPSLLLFLWVRGWFGVVSSYGMIYGYIAIYLCLILGILGIAAFIFVVIMWWRTRKDKEPLDIIAEELRDIKNRLPKQRNNKEHKTTDNEELKNNNGGATKID
jgi:uncharacterized membrane protein